MASWRDAILNDFVPNVSKLTLVADPDCLLTEEKLALELRGRGFDLIEFSDPVEFRYAYESKYRSIWDSGGRTDQSAVLRLSDSELDALPYDLLQAGRQLAFNLAELFPNLSYPVIEKLDRSLFDALFDAQSQTGSERMGDNATKDFVLRHVFGVAAELITNDVELLRTLLRLHYGKLEIPDILAERLVQVLCERGVFQTWPLAEIVPDSEAFFAFLQERWPVFLDSLGKANPLREHHAEYALKYPGPGILPLDHQDIRVYIDNLFVERKLHPIETTDLAIDANSWARIGLVAASSNDDGGRITRLFGILEDDLPAAESRHDDWIDHALKWAELSALVHCERNGGHRARLHDVGDKLNAAFTTWLSTHYASLVNLPPTHPPMLHHVPRRLARDLQGPERRRVALIVVDGLALDQWVTVRQILQRQDNKLVMRESATFAWIPTLTSVSRQAIFSGKPPIYFQSTINSTHSEDKLWKQFWESCGIPRLDVAYCRGLGDGDVSEVLDDALHPGKTRAIGLVVDKVDKIMHGMQLGAAGMHNQIKQWCRKGFLASLIGYLMDYRFDVWLTADHGNVECVGKGRPAEGVIAETRGERVRVYPTAELRSRVAAEFAFAREWPSIGLPPNYFPLVAGGHDAFINLGESVVGHGGIAIEEVIVPLVRFERPSR